MDSGLILALLVAAGACFGAYAAIRADLGALHERTAQAIEASSRAHARIDAIERVRRATD